jgi:NhaP-type Na+/H+ or K+/H+ antiporter
LHHAPPDSNLTGGRVLGFGVIAALVFCFGLVSRRLEGTAVTAPMLFVAAGLVAGWTGMLEIGGEVSRDVALAVSELALVLLLFADAARLDVRALRGNPLPLRLLGIGLPLTLALGMAAALALLGELALWECAIVAVVLAPTDAALGRAVVANPRLAKPLRDGLSVESGLNDGVSVPFLALFIALALAEEDVERGWLTFALEQIGYGALIGSAAGFAGGLALRRAAVRGWTTPEFERLALAALAVVAWAAADEAGGNGLIAAFVGGGGAGIAVGSLRDRMLGFAEEDGQLLNLMVFFIFGLFAAEALAGATGAMVVYAVLSLTVVRMLAVAIATLGVGLEPAEVGLLGWFGPRGLASVVLALVVVGEAPALPGLDEIFLVMTLTVLLSVFLHGLTAAPLSSRLAGTGQASASRQRRAAS